MVSAMNLEYVDGLSITGITRHPDGFPCDVYKT